MKRCNTMHPQNKLARHSVENWLKMTKLRLLYSSRRICGQLDPNSLTLRTCRSDSCLFSEWWRNGHRWYRWKSLFTAKWRWCIEGNCTCRWSWNSTNTVNIACIVCSTIDAQINDGNAGRYEFIGTAVVAAQQRFRFVQGHNLRQVFMDGGSIIKTTHSHLHTMVTGCFDTSHLMFGHYYCCGH